MVTGSVIFVPDYFHGGNLSDVLRKKKTLKENVARFYIGETILAVQHLHEVGTLSH
jgi:serine/threonine protein kinase